MPLTPKTVDNLIEARWHKIKSRDLDGWMEAPRTMELFHSITVIHYASNADCALDKEGTEYPR